MLGSGTRFFAAAAALVGLVGASPSSEWERESKTLKPKVMILDMYSDEGAAWWNIPEFDLLAKNVSVPGLSVVYPEAHCTHDGQICQVICDEGEINSAASVTALWLSPLFDLTQTYFLIAGDAGISPKVGTLASVAFARFAVQVALQYEIDAREIEPGWTTGYVPQGATAPGQFPTFLYGTEVYELNEPLRQRAISVAKKAILNDSADAQTYRNLYKNNSAYAVAVKKPEVIACDTATSDNWWSGALLGAAFENITKVLTGNEGNYCTTQQEDNAVLGALIRGAVAKKVDFTRIMSLRTGTDFDRPPPGMSAADNLFNGQDAGYDPAVLNIYLAGVKVVEDIVKNWDATFKKGIKPTNYVGDIAGTLGTQPPFVPASFYSKRSIIKKRTNRRAT
ncbi:purine nucleoside permease-like protein [Clavulina sp. PMI_390]|nr:purine nucleoside permease-like protein [Clavulina sp. PMI_390]